MQQGVRSRRPEVLMNVERACLSMMYTCGYTHTHTSYRASVVLKGAVVDGKARERGTRVTCDEHCSAAEPFRTPFSTGAGARVIDHIVICMVVNRHTTHDTLTTLLPACVIAIRTQL